ncbi:hypothetical protein E2L00_13890 [Cedecea colo]|uniref:Uncharacterized protein n=1 Tax=Cedecea colo TaxID=2552946 RepID=A0ABX0VQU1_9ENTR|nr:hypothetical protein [Cedecea colo]
MNISKSGNYTILITVTALGNMPDGGNEPSCHRGTMKAINHTKWAINHFSIDGQSGIDAIGPFQDGRVREFNTHCQPFTK